MSGSGEQVKVGGVWLATIGGVGELSWSTIADGGSESASWKMDLGRAASHPVLRAGKPVEIYLGPFPIWAGSLNQPDQEDDGCSFSAAGSYTDGDGYLCFDSGGNTTSTPDTAVDQAIARGLNWTRPSGISAAALSTGAGDTDSLNYLSGLLDAWALKASKRWQVNALRQVVTAADPTVPMWHIKPGSSGIGLADDDYASDVYVRYKTSAAAFATAHVADALASSVRRREAPVDATGIGVLDSTGATNIGNGTLSRGKARYQWTDAASPSSFQITTSGGQPADLRLVQSQQMVRMHGVRDEQGYPLAYFDFVIGRTEYQAGSDVIQISPVNLAARNLGDLFAAVG